MPDPTPPVPLKAAGPLETRWPCPVCLGVQMQKAPIAGRGGTLIFDYCTRCGGLWFDRGEVGQLAGRPEQLLHEHVTARVERVKPPCHGCQSPLDRDAEKCPVCNHRNVINCPVCDEAMERRPHAGLVLDVCRRCQGVWFDNAELSAIWRMNVAAATAKGGRRGGEALAVGGDVLLNAMFWTPDLVLFGGVAAGHAVGAVAEVAGSAAEGVFSFIVEIISGLFD